MDLSVSGILYAEDFDEPAVHGSEPEPEPDPARFTASDLDAARYRAGADAVQAARADWDASAVQARTQSLAAIAAAVGAAKSDAVALTEAVAEGTARTILAMVAGLLPELCARHGAAEVQALMRHLLPTLAQQPRLTVRVAPAVLDAVRADFALLDEDLAAAIVLTPSALLPGDARVTWADGGLARDQAAIQAAMTAALAGLGLVESLPNRSMAHAE